MSRYLLIAASLVVASAARSAEAVRVEIGSLPAVGQPGPVTGRVIGVKPASCRVTVFMWHHGWFTKPRWGEGLRSLAADGTFSVPVNTHPNDVRAGAYAVFVLPADFALPEGRGERTIDEQVYLKSLASAEVRRRGAESYPPRTLRFAGHIWWVKSSTGVAGPGGNYFSDSERSVWVDDRGRLHLKLCRSEGHWTCAELVAVRSFGHGTYRFQVTADLAALHERVVLGLFTWSDQPADHHREIDIEFSRWGQLNNLPAQFVVQPHQTKGNLTRYAVPPGVSTGWHEFTWRPREVAFRSTLGDQVLAEWRYGGPDVPAPGDEHPRLNLWLMRGPRSLPDDAPETEVVIDRFEHRP